MVRLAAAPSRRAGPGVNVLERVQPRPSSAALKNGHAVAAEHARSAHARVLHTYDSAIHGYAAKLSGSGLAKVKADPRVAYVTQDVVGKPVESQTLPTGVDRVDADLSPTAQ